MGNTKMKEFKDFPLMSEKALKEIFGDKKLERTTKTPQYRWMQFNDIQRMSYQKGYPINEVAKYWGVTLTAVRFKHETFLGLFKYYMKWSINHQRRVNSEFLKLLEFADSHDDFCWHTLFGKKLRYYIGIILLDEYDITSLTEVYRINHLLGRFMKCLTDVDYIEHAMFDVDELKKRYLNRQTDIDDMYTTMMSSISDDREMESINDAYRIDINSNSLCFISNIMYYMSFRFRFDYNIPRLNIGKEGIIAYLFNKG